MPMLGTVGARSVSNSRHLDSEYHRATQVSPRSPLCRDGRFRHLHEPAGLSIRIKTVTYESQQERNKSQDIYFQQICDHGFLRVL